MGTYFSGLGNVNSLLPKVIGVGITVKGTTFTDATIVADATWKTNISSSTPASRNTSVYPLRVYTPTSEDIGIETSNIGIKDKTNEPPPSMTGFLLCGAYDFKALHSLAGTKFDVVLFLADGSVMCTRKADGNLKGFRAILETRADIPKADSVQQSYPLYIYFTSINEFKEFQLFKPDWVMEDILEYVPVGLDLKQASTLSASTGIVSLSVMKRQTTTPMTGLIAADFTVLESNGSAPVQVTAVSEVGQGIYTVTINEDVGGSASALEAGEWALVQVAKIASSNITYQSQVEKITAV